jgi:DNA-binding response OmpR family regulator
MFLKNVLIFSDDRITATVLDCALSLEGFRIGHCSEISRAKEKVAEGGFDIAVIDMETAGIEGYDLCRKIKNKRVNGVPYLIVMSAGTISGELAQLLEADYFLSKPFRMEMLLNIMNELSMVRKLDCIYR